jgi:excisionase family DNA binding protein
MTRRHATPEPKLLTATDVSLLCQIDSKTVHNWCRAGRIKHFRTPGRHLRFRRADVVEFLQEWGYPVPSTLESAVSA